MVHVTRLTLLFAFSLSCWGFARKDRIERFRPFMDWANFIYVGSASCYISWFHRPEGAKLHHFVCHWQQLRCWPHLTYEAMRTTRIITDAEHGLRKRIWPSERNNFFSQPIQLPEKRIIVEILLYLSITLSACMYAVI